MACTWLHVAHCVDFVSAMTVHFRTFYGLAFWGYLPACDGHSSRILFPLSEQIQLCASKETYKLHIMCGLLAVCSCLSFPKM